MKKPRIAIIGAGTFGEMHLKAFSQMARDGYVELVGVADLNEELLAKRREKYGVATFGEYAAMIEKTRPDGVSIVTPDHLHLEIATAVLKAGCHVLVEKPLDTSVEGCEKMITTAAKENLLLEVDFHKRFDAYHIDLHDKVRDGKIGDVLYAYAHMEDKIVVPRDWFPGWAPKSSPFWFLGVHFVDLIRYITGQNGVEVLARGQKKKLCRLGIDTYDHISAQILFSGGMVATIDAAWVLPEGFEAVVNQALRVVGTDGMLECDSQDRGARAVTAEGGQATLNLGFYQEKKKRDGTVAYTGYGIDSICDFGHNLRFLINGGTLDEIAGTYPSGVDGLEATKICQAVARSLESKTTEKV